MANYQKRKGRNYYAQVKSMDERGMTKKSSFESKYLNEGDNKGFPICWGFKKAGRGNGVIKLYARPYSKTKWHKAKQGKAMTHCNLFVTLTNSTTGMVQKTSGLFCKETGKLVISELGLVGSPEGRGVTASGKTAKGYFGKIG